jgi:4'-phosphopantetheinyl transferase
MTTDRSYGDRIRESEVVIWLARVEKALAHRSEEQILASLQQEDREDVARARVPHVRRERIVARALLQLGLSWYLDQPPGGWRISRGELGRPDLVPAAGQPDLRFNLSHSGGLVACGFTLGKAIGVDVEHRERALPPPEEFARYLSPSERARCSAAPESTGKDEFLRHWTLKEAYAKALGLGVSMGFDRFSIDLDGPPKLRHAPGETAEWYLEQWELEPAHWLALAVRQPSGGALSCRLVQVVDLLHPPSRG